MADATINAGIICNIVNYRELEKKFQEALSADFDDVDATKRANAIVRVLKQISMVYREVQKKELEIEKQVTNNIKLKTAQEKTKLSQDVTKRVESNNRVKEFIFRQGWINKTNLVGQQNKFKFDLEQTKKLNSLEILSKKFDFDKEMFKLKALADAAKVDQNQENKKEILELKDILKEKDALRREGVLRAQEKIVRLENEGTLEAIFERKEAAKEKYDNDSKLSAQKSLQKLNEITAKTNYDTQKSSDKKDEMRLKHQLYMEEESERRITSASRIIRSEESRKRIRDYENTMRNQEKDHASQLRKEEMDKRQELWRERQDAMASKSMYGTGLIGKAFGFMDNIGEAKGGIYDIIDFVRGGIDTKRGEFGKNAKRGPTLAYAAGGQGGLGGLKSLMSLKGIGAIAGIATAAIAGIVKFVSIPTKFVLNSAKKVAGYFVNIAKSTETVQKLTELIALPFKIIFTLGTIPLLTGFIPVLKQMVSWITENKGTIEEIANLFATIFTTVFSGEKIGIISALMNGFAQVLEYFGTVVSNNMKSINTDSVSQFISSTIAALAGVVQDVLVGLIEWSYSSEGQAFILSLSENFGRILGSIVSFIIAELPVILQSALTFIYGIIEGFGTIGYKLFASALDWIDSATNGALTSVANGIISVVNWFIDRINDVSSFISNLTGGFIGKTNWGHISTWDSGSVGNNFGSAASYWSNTNTISYKITNYNSSLSDNSLKNLMQTGGY